MSLPLDRPIEAAEPKIAAPSPIAAAAIDAYRPESQAIFNAARSGTSDSAQSVLPDVQFGFRSADKTQAEVQDVQSGSLSADKTQSQEPEVQADFRSADKAQSFLPDVQFGFRSTENGTGAADKDGTALAANGINENEAQSSSEGSVKNLEGTPFAPVQTALNSIESQLNDLVASFGLGTTTRENDGTQPGQPGQRQNPELLQQYQT